MLLLTALLGVGVGCSAGPSNTIDRWAGEHGGVLVDARQDRAERTLARLSVANVTSKRLSIAILDTSAIGAFSWPCGQVFVTRGLVDLVDDDELCAAIAHEAGHLVVDGHLPPPAALDGSRRSSRQGCEIVADRMACALLKGSSVDEQALPRLLKKIANQPAASPASRTQLSHRIAQLSTTDRAD
jgi:predicted Zn-dependent protease